MITSMFHTGFVVQDMERAVAFYRDALGLEVQRRAESTGEGISAMLGFPNTHLKLAFLGKGDGHVLELIEYVSPPGRDGHGPKNALGATHLAFYVDDIQQTFRTLAARGARVSSPPTEVRPGRVACYLQDPEGNWLELVEVRNQP